MSTTDLESLSRELQMSGPGNHNGMRFVTMTFDDGLINGARKTAQIFDEFGLKATFYVVTGWVGLRQILWIRDRWNRGLDHGTWQDWFDISERGHDVGSHTVTHLNATGRLSRYVGGLLRWELRHSFAKLHQQLGKRPTSISMPWNTPATQAEEELRLYAACRLGSGTLRANNLENVNWYALDCWAPDAKLPADEIVDRIRRTPPGHWLILQFHSLNGEGYMPITSTTLREIMRGLKETPNLQHASVGEMIARFHDATIAIGGKRALSPRKRICIVTSEQLSTNPRVVKEADALHDAGYAVRVVACQWMDWPRREDAKLLASRRWRCDILDYSRRSSPELFWWSRLRHNFAGHLPTPLLYKEAVMLRAAGRVIPELTRLAAKEPADLFIGHNLAGLPAAVIAAKRHQAQSGFDAEDFHSKMWLHEIGPLLSDRFAARVERHFLPQCVHLTAASPLIAAGYAKEYSIPTPETILNVFPLSFRPKELRLRNPTAPLTLYWFSQTIGARRGLEDVIRAIGMTGSTSIQLHLRGEWQWGYEKNLRSFAQASGLRQDQIVAHQLAPPEEMARLAAEYDIGLALEQTVSENRDICLTNKIFVYLLAGVAIIATGTRGQKPLMEKIPGAGLCYEPGDIQRLAQQLREWEINREALHRARQCAWQFGEKDYNWEVERRKLLAAVEETFAAPAFAKCAI